MTMMHTGVWRGVKGWIALAIVGILISTLSEPAFGRSSLDSAPPPTSGSDLPSQTLPHNSDLSSSPASPPTPAPPPPPPPPPAVPVPTPAPPPPSPTTPTVPQSPPPASTGSKSGLSGGAKAGIAFGVIFGVIGAGICYCCFKRKKNTDRQRRFDGTPYGLEMN